MNPSPIALRRPELGQACPCGSGKVFDLCCGPILNGLQSASTAEELMRSRFSAHVLGDFGYLHRTHLPTAKIPYVAEALDYTNSWTRLIVHGSGPGQKPETAWVDFSAYYLENGAERVLDEKSEFLRIDGAWLYARTLRQGPAPFKSAGTKTGRNEPCPCGSGRKYKHCCLAQS